MFNSKVPVLDIEGLSIAEITVREVNGRYYIERTLFINSFSREVDQLTATRIRKSALSNDWKTLHSFHAEFLPWYCPICDQNYAESQWQVRTIFEGEDNWLDSFRGICPRGHERMIAD